LEKGYAVTPVRLLIINPNTTSRITTLLETHAKTIVGTEVEIRAVTARFGAPYIACEASYAVAGHATLDAWAAALAPEQPAPHAVLIGCFGDPGLLALRETSRVPVTGLAEASFVEASSCGQFAIVTGGPRWKPMLERLAQALGYRQLLAGIYTVTPSGAQLAEDPAAARILLATACREAASHFKARAVILGGAGLAGVAADIQGEVDVPVIDSVLAGTRYALKIASLMHPPALGRFDFGWQNVSPELAALGLSGE
jgi:allantoin racemase